jgi:UDP-N-acetylglucosamine 2-epimerase (non-hydrolysing)
MPKKVICVAGARPNFMKLAPLLKVLSADSDFQPLLTHTGQHYSDQMSGQFFRDLGLPAPDHYLEVGSGSHGAQTGEIMRRFEEVVLAERPDAVVVVGDVNSTLAGALVAAKLHIPVAHLESGLRSFDRSMPEEINRLATDAVCDLLLVTEESGAENLRREGVACERIRVVGNLMIDTLLQNRERARESRLPAEIGARDGEFGLVTLHRPSNVDDPAKLQELIEALGVISATIPVYFPAHPRTRGRLGALPPGIVLLEPLGYIDFVALMSRSRVVLTDSGGIQEETTGLAIPCLTLRENTERPITITEGTNRLAGVTKKSILAAWQEFLDNPKTGRVPPLWDGHAAERSRDALRELLGLPPL